MKIFRITDSKWSDKLVASGRPARWNSKDVAMLYFAQSISLACLENAVHRSKIELKDKNYSLVEVEVPDNFKEINLKELPSGWNKITPEAIFLCRAFGDRWIQSNSSLLLRVPSVIVNGEYNFLVNPKHPDFNKIKILKTSPFLFDSRLK